jgi:hypothetical protein
VSAAADGFDEFRRHYGFDDWRAPRPDRAALFIWRFALGGQELPGHEPVRIDTVELPDLVPTIQSLWRPDKEDAERVLLRVDVSEAPSVTEARELLLRTLAQFQSPLIERVSDGPGDIAFGPSGYRSVAFARANIVVVVRNAGDEVESVEPTARELDRLLHEGPDADRSSVRPTIRRAEAEVASVAGRRRVRLLVVWVPRTQARPGAQLLREREGKAGSSAGVGSLDAYPGSACRDSVVSLLGASSPA